MKNSTVLKKKRCPSWLLITFFMLLSFYCMPLFTTTASNNSLKYQNIMLSLKVQNKTFGQVFEELKMKSGYSFFFRDDAINLDTKVSINTDNLTIEETLNELFETTGNTYRIEGTQIFISKGNTTSFETDTRSKLQTQQDNVSVSGVVRDADGEPLSGVSITIKGIVAGTMSSADGSYKINVSEGATLIFSFIGFNPQEIVVGSNKVINVIMKEDDKLLDEVIVTALGIKRSEKALGYSVQKISGEALQTVKGTNIATSLTGKVAGLTIKNSTELKEGPEMTLRGETPLMVIDGVPFSNLKLKDLAPEDIESIDILKGATASALYGERGKSGAVMITTKRGKDGKIVINV